MRVRRGLRRRGEGRTTGARHAGHVPAADVLVEGERVAEHICTRTHEAGRHGDAEAEGGCEEGCRGKGRDAQAVFVPLAMFQLLMSWLKEVAL